jgi:putative ABC transport system permease protein
VSVNLYVLGFTLVLAVVTALAFGLIPAIYASRTDAIDVLRASGGSASFGPAIRRFGKALVAAEVMLSLTLLVGATLLIESVNRLTSVPLGFRTNGILLVPVDLPKWNYAEAKQRSAFYREAIQRVETIAGVESVAVASTLPITNGRWGGSTLSVESKPDPDPRAAVRDIAATSISPDYFRVMGVSLERGRFFDAGDRSDSLAVAIVNQALARKYFAHEDPIGKRIRLGPPDSHGQWLSIVGVAANEKDRNFFNEMAWEEIPVVFRPLSQDVPLTATFVIRAASERLELGTAIQKQIAEIDHNAPVGGMETMNGRLAHSLAYPRFRAFLLGTFAALALLLAAVGLYGVLSQLIVQRTQEFGVRMALGAQKRDIMALVIRQGMLLTGAGLACGLGAAFSLTRFLNTLLYDVRPTDAWMLATVCAVLIVVALFATAIPARHASRVDPIAAIRYE